MKKKLLFLIMAALLAAILIVTPVLADDVDVEVSDIEVSGPTYYGATVTVSGSVTITAEADSDVWGWWDYANAGSSAYYEITNGAAVISQDSNDLYDSDSGPWGASASASQTYNWSYTFFVGQGEYNITQGGEAFAESFAHWWFLTYGYEYDGDIDSVSLSLMGSRAPGWYDNGSFELVVQDFTNNHTCYPLSNGMLVGGVSHFAGVPGVCSLKVVIPEGTVVSNTRLLIRYTPGYGVEEPFSFSNDDCEFSQPVTIYKVIGGGELQELLTFNTVENGVATLE